MAGKKKNDEKSKGKDAGGGKGGKGKEEQKDGGKAAKKGGQVIYVRHILCAKHSKKEEALARVRENHNLKGFADAAREFSEDKAKQGGYLGKVTKGALDPAFEAVAWSLPISSDSSMSVGEAKTEHGYHLIVVESPK